jgi:hypothetical protein
MPDSPSERAAERAFLKLKGRRHPPSFLLPAEPAISALSLATTKTREVIRSGPGRPPFSKLISGRRPIGGQPPAANRDAQTSNTGVQQRADHFYTTKEADSA